MANCDQDHRTRKCEDKNHQDPEPKRLFRANGAEKRDVESAAMILAGVPILFDAR